MLSTLIIALVSTCTLLAVNGASISSSQCSIGPSYWCSNILTAKECFAMQYCLENNWATSHAQVEQDDKACAMCKKLIGDTRDFLSNKTVTEEIAQLLDQACSTFTDDFMVNECKVIIKHYLSEAMALLVAELDPETVCSAVHICDSQVELRVDSLIQQLLSKMLKVNVGTDYCGVCIETAGEMLTLASKSGSKQYIENVLLQQVCPSISEKIIRDECTKLVKSSFSELWTAVIAALKDANATCAELGFCTSTAMRPYGGSFQKLVPSLVTPVNALGNASLCDICKDAVALIEQELQDAKTLLEQTVAGFCQNLGPLAEMCQEFTQQGIDTLFNETAQIFNSQSCINWNLCAASSYYKRASNEDYCATCEKMIDNMYLLASKPGTEDYIKKLMLDQVCAKMKSWAERKECDVAVKASFSSLWSTVVAALQKPNATCIELGYCNSTRLALSKVRGNSRCQLCKSAASNFLVALGNPQGITVSQIKMGMTSYCEKSSDECKLLVAHSDRIAVHIHAGANHEEICQDLELCEAIDSRRNRAPWYKRY